MSRVAKAPVTLPEGIECRVADGRVEVASAQAALGLDLPGGVEIEVESNQARAVPTGRRPNQALAGTVRSQLENLVRGVSQGFERRLQLVGVGYRAQLSGQTLTLSLGLSHPVVYAVPAAVAVTAPSATEIVLRSADKQVLGQTAAEIRAFRPPEPYKGKGIRHAGERVILKDPKKK